MNVHSIQQHTGRRSFIAGVQRLVAVCGVVVLITLSMWQRAGAESGFPISLAQGGVASGNVQAGQSFTHGDEAFRVVNTSAVRTAADSGFAASPSQAVRQVGYSNACVSCGTSCGGSCGGLSSCGSCGTQCGGSCGGGYASGGYGSLSAFGSPCAPCEPYCYGSIEALYMERTDEDRYSLSPNFEMGGFDLELGGRITIGSVPDCVYGCELTFTSPLDWDMGGDILNVGGNIQTYLRAGSQLVPTDLSAFNDTVTASAQYYTAKYWSVEANRTLMGWDIAKLLYGVRYINYEERFSYFSRNATESGLFRSGTDNRMYGLHAGADLLYPISRHAYTDFRTRIGAFVNHVESELRLVNDGVLHIANSDDGNKLSGVFELGGGVRYQLGQALSVRAGVELWYLARIATANDQYTNVLSPASSGRSVRSKDDVLITGISLGAELRY